MHIDDLDRTLLALLRENARLSVVDLARRLDLSRTTVAHRLGRLEAAKVITGYTVRVAEAMETGLVRAHITIALHPKAAPAVEAALRRIPEVRQLHSVSGPFDLIAVVAAPSIRELDGLIDRIGALDGVERTTSSIVLSTRIDR
ncbi:Lrp/AsnC family transcriptional regulator [Chthonobacter albigriseus]|uniref:Lrp/AsnC family transcriptional regulator n=1 Tax=Chthonobacter albigriseus TaxID=1683161 RepID=UPI0015EFB605|nr:Lrp/AsnC family transcriptional regulator [Chthonobacter albigriseus]